MPLRNVATTFTIEQQRLEINNLAGDVNNIATGVTTTTASGLAAGATGADLTLSGTLTVNGTQTILNTETLQVEDKEIVIGNVSSPTNATANGGGWKLKGADNKTITYSQTGDKWVSNKDFEAPAFYGDGSNLTGISSPGGANALSFNDDVKLIVGSGNDLEIYHSGHENYIKDAGNSGSGAGTIIIDGSNGVKLREGGSDILHADTNLKSYADFYIFNGKNLTMQGAGSTLSAGGSVAIGKTTAGANLDIAATNSSSVGTHGFRLGAFGIRTEDVDSYNVWAIEKNYGGWGSAVVLQASGRVGIGTGTAATELDALLTIKGDSNGDSNPSIRLKDGSDSRECWMSNVSGDLYLANGGNDNAYHSRIRLMDGRAIYFDIEGAVNAFSVDANDVYDSKGPLRSVPQNTQTGNYTLTHDDNGKHIFASGNVTIPPSIFTAGDIITVVNNTAGDINIVAGAGQGIYNSATASTAVPKTLAQRGMATILITNSSTCYVSGTSLSDP